MMSRRSTHRALHTAAIFFFLLLAASIREISASYCAEEFDGCYSTAECCGRHNPGMFQVECVMGTEKQPQVTTCKSKRSQALDQLSIDNKMDYESVLLLTKMYIYHSPHVKEKHEKKTKYMTEEDIDSFFHGLTARYTNNLSKLFADTEREFGIDDPTVLAFLLRDFLSWRDMVDLEAVFEGKYDKEGEVPFNHTKKGGGWDEDEPELGENEVRVM